MLRKQILPAVMMTLVLCVITGFIYPGVVTGLDHDDRPGRPRLLTAEPCGRPVGHEPTGSPLDRPSSRP